MAIDGQKMFGAFGRAGLLKSATWTPKGGGTPETRDVYFDTRDQEVGVGAAGAISREYSIQYPIDYFIGMERSDLVVIGPDTYFVRGDPEQQDTHFMTARLGRRQ